MKMHLAIVALLIAGTTSVNAQQKTKSTYYFPPAGAWQTQAPAQLGLSADAIRQTISFAKEHEAKASRNGELAQFQSFGKEPFSEAVGPLTDRGGSTGIIIHKGYIVAQWGELNRVDIVNSVTKSLLSTVIGLAVDRGLIKSTVDTVANYVPFVELYNFGINNPVREDVQNSIIYPFASAHNRKLTWEVMLRQTSDWEGTLWGKPDWADRPQGEIEQYKTRQSNEPGSIYKYNDVRVNALALAATSVWRKPLPQVLKENIMDPIGASTTWRWTGYRTSWIVMDGQPVQSVSGGGHWGGGAFINAYDMARFGLLTLRQGNWNGKQLISKQWVKQALTPTTANKGYGYMNWFLNTDKKMLPSAPETAWVHIGNGTNMIYCDPEHDVVMVVRWIENKDMDGVVKTLLAAFKK
ncbi:serine hydrolase domain-containing protein [Mucilaginibacter terrae]|uniref:CubicO group peptidase (Beta-lactamase class C family) n=1 Tax=Mucilaginibacter terrae TaxID=1955052 RepID=A0ABU3GQ43_9SPHI|nr:serine hydrolase [Mucilaginibacter terrae]MDT3401601.1 CubicO group peptidase (beta-lactamase class C family) [Mucilaginibacter terrae]